VNESQSWTYSEENGNIGRIAISDDGNYIVGAGYNGDVYLFRRTSSVPIWIYRALDNSNGIGKVVISSSGETVAAFTYYGDLLIFNNASSNPIWTTNLNEPILNPKMDISKDGKSLLIGDNLINITSSLSLHNFSAPSAMTADGNYILTPQFLGPSNPHINLTETVNFSAVLHYNYTGNTNEPSFSISSNGNQFVIGSSSGTIYFYNKTNATPLWNYTGYGSIDDIEMSASGNEFTAFDDRYIYFFQKNSTIPVWSRETSVEDISISSDGNYIVTSNIHLVLFHRSSPVPVWESNFFSGDEVAISHNGNYFATAMNNVRFISRADPPQIIPDWNLYFSLLFNIGYTSVVIVISLVGYKRYKRNKESKRFQKFKEIIKESDQVEMEEIYKLFKKEYDKRTFYRKIFEWASEFNFTIDGETLLLKEGSIADFIKRLDNMFLKWEQDEKEKA